MPLSLADQREELALANRILANEGVLDAFGHVSMRHPSDPSRFMLSRHRAPELVVPADIYQFNLQGEPAEPMTVRGYSERVIHGAIYEARPDVNAVCHHHAPAIMPYAVSGMELVPIFHLGATMGPKVPCWDQQDEFSDTSLLVVKVEEGRALARALGPNWTVIMRRHGATVAGRSLREVVFRSIYTCRNAEYQTLAHGHGHVQRLTPGEAALAEAHNTRDFPMQRAWDYWVRRVDPSGIQTPPDRGTKPAIGKAAVRPIAKKPAGARKPQAPA
ncbi:MAG: class II aldolase/adducin family protein, partial [Proteobacteria bacterium]|nr:class II aldolase/adducin family protein [Pseudomonadota bacterium]